jgi:hypothetical protein
MCASTIGLLFVTGLDVQAAEVRATMLHSALRSRMEWVCAQPLSVLADGSEVRRIANEDIEISWTRSAVDLDRDGLPEPDAARVEVSGGGLQLSTLLIERRRAVKF